MFNHGHSGAKVPMHKLLSALVLLVVGLALAPATSGAASTTYIGGDSSTFSNSVGGWQSTEEYNGLCLQGLTCPTVGGEYVATGGAGGANDGFIRTTSGTTTLAALLSSSVQIWRSPQFTYNGIGGKVPAALSFDMSKRSGFTDLLALGASADYRVTALNQSGGPDRVLIDTRTVGNQTTWEKVPQVPLIPGSLAIGDNYVLEIRTSIGGLAAVLPAGDIDYDSVELTASDSGGGGGGGGGGGTVLPPPKVIPPGVAYLYKNKLYIRVKCPKAFKPRCRVNAVALTKKRRGKLMTKNVRATVRSGGFIRKALQVKPKYSATVKALAKVNAKTITVRLKIRSSKGKKKGTVFNQLRVLERTK
ncbi:MAG TPA: hypothetical protein VMF31_09345 [Solirubrobacterales bacterium]|nr:hypothetical protein [Solirubrobacterales bacterium]